MHRLDFNYTIIVPMAELIHETIVAFMRTSDHGAWKSDDTKENDPFRMNFIRGKWGREFGFAGRRVPHDVWESEDDKSRKPMLAEVTIRPAPQRARIRLTIGVCDLRKPSAKYREIHQQIWADYLDEEVKDMQEYFKECFGMEALPELES